MYPVKTLDYNVEKYVACYGLNVKVYRNKYKLSNNHHMLAIEYDEYKFDFYTYHLTYYMDAWSL